jgi:hypothetical protein
MGALKNPVGKKLPAREGEDETTIMLREERNERNGNRRE